MKKTETKKNTKTKPQKHQTQTTKHHPQKLTATKRITTSTKTQKHKNTKALKHKKRELVVFECWVFLFPISPFLFLFSLSPRADFFRLSTFQKKNSLTLCAIHIQINKNSIVYMENSYKPRSRSPIFSTP